MAQITAGEVVAIEGKVLRRSFAKGTGKQAIPMVSAWASENGVVLGQRKVDTKSNEITALPVLLNLWFLKGGIVTIVAMGGQRAIAEKIVAQGADYVLALKGNQPTLEQAVASFFGAGPEAESHRPQSDYYALLADALAGTDQNRSSAVVEEALALVEQTQEATTKQNCTDCEVSYGSEPEGGRPRVAPRVPRPPAVNMPLPSSHSRENTQNRTSRKRSRLRGASTQSLWNCVP